VIYLGTVSKTLSPTLRLGWLVAPPPLLQPMTQAFAGSTGSALEQHALARFIAGGDYDRHLRRMRQEYEARRDALLAGLQQSLPALEVTGVAAGLHVMIRLPNRAAETGAVRLLKDRGIWVMPLRRYQHGDAGAGIVLSFARLAPQHATRVSRTLAAVL
jgi:GntR family transcriptional regulator/MocR family aminotransferase